MVAPSDCHWIAVKRLLCYLNSTHLGLQLLKVDTLDLITYSDVDWAGCPEIEKA